MAEIITAEKMAKSMREVSVAEFFEKNRHLLGYENPTKSLITIVKERVDNSLDACDEANILPTIKISMKPTTADRFRIVVEDNGPGVVEEKVPLAFGSLLYGSKFHRLRQSRGTQGIGVSGAILYSQLTTGKPAIVTSSTGKKINVFELSINVANNQPKVILHKRLNNPDKWCGVKIEMEAEGKYIERFQSIPEYLKQTAIANPHAHIIYDGPNGRTDYKRSVNEPPEHPREIKPHPHGIELGILRRMILNTNTKSVIGFLTSDFSRVGKGSADQICKLAKIDCNSNPKKLSTEDSDRLHKAMQMVKLIAPPTNCLSPLKEKTIVEGLKKELQAEFFVSISRSPTVYRGNPFQIEVGLAYGGALAQNETCKLYRFANKVPLLYNQSDCAITEAVTEVDWRRYWLTQSTNALPVGPLAILVHFASVWVPFTSEGKQAIASYPEIIKEIKLALQDAGRKLSKFISQQRRDRERQIRRQIFERYMPEVAESLSKLTEKDKKIILKKLEYMIKNKTLIKEEIEEKKDETDEKEA